MLHEINLQNTESNAKDLARFWNRYFEGVSQRNISSSTGHSRNTVSDVVQRAKRLGLESLNDEMTSPWLETFLFPEKQAVEKGYFPVDWGKVHKELRSYANLVYKRLFYILFIVALCSASSGSFIRTCWLKTSHKWLNSSAIIIWEEGEQINQLKLRKQNKEHLELLRYKISRTIQTLFSFEEDHRAPFKMDQIHEYFGKWDWIKK